MRTTAVLNERGCWLWQGTRDSRGYGVVKLTIRGVGQRMLKAHRLMWLLMRGALPRGSGHHGICVLHKCDNPRCVNPAHLFLGTVSDNNADRVRKGRTHSILTSAQVREIRRKYGGRKRMPYGQSATIALHYGISERQLHSVRTSKMWKHL